MKRILLASVAALGLAGTASAADLAVKAPVVYAPVFTWSGCYLGINGGWIGSNESFQSGAAVDPLGYTPFDAAASANSYAPNSSAGTAGGQFGCQAQLGSWVIGGEWDWNWSGLKDTNFYSDPNLVGAIFGVPWTQYTQKEMDWFMTARARLGFAWDRVLLYVTGGLAYASFDAYTEVAAGSLGVGVPDHFGSYHKNRIGYVVGGGLEWAFANNWTAKAEFLYLDFGSFDYTSGWFANPIAPVTNFYWRNEVDASEYVARIGINYLFHTGGAPVVAKY